MSTFFTFYSKSDLSQKKKHQPLKVSVSNIVVLLENQLLCSNYLFSITVIMQFYSKTSIESVCQSSFPALPHEQYHLAYVHQLKMGSPDYAFSYFL